MLKLTTSQLRNERKNLKEAQGAERAGQASLQREQKQRARLQKQIQRLSDADDLSDQPISPEVPARAPVLEAMKGELETAHHRVAVLTVENERLSGQLRSAHMKLSQRQIQVQSVTPVPKTGEPMADFLTRAFDKLLSGLAGGFGLRSGGTSKQRPETQAECCQSTNRTASW